MQHASVSFIDLDAEPQSELLQRRWFAALTATRRLEAECLQRLTALRDADEAWRRACTELAEFEILTEALEEQLTGRDQAPPRVPAGPLEPSISPPVFAA